MLVHVEIPGMSLNLQDPLLRLTGIHPRQTGGIPIGQVFTDCARDGGVRPIRLPGSGTGQMYSVKVQKFTTSLWLISKYKSSAKIYSYEI